MSLRENLLNTCSFLDVFEGVDINNKPKKEMGYFRCDYDGYRWHNTVWKVNKENETEELIKEFDELYSSFIKEFPDLNSVAEYCKIHAEHVGENEYNAFYEGKYGNYWFRFRLIKRDYNLYLHAYVK